MAYFKVDTRLAVLLGESYRSSEYALKELVDNAWDADASTIEIILPKPFGSSEDPIFIKDDGLGMTPEEVNNEYLKVARDRISQKGTRTIGKERLVKGRKGIGKFAGLVVADVMLLETKSNGKRTKLVISRDELKEFADLEKVDLPLDISECGLEEHGTEITLYKLNQNLSFPDVDTLKQILFVEYSRENDFEIYVNETKADIEDLTGEVFEGETELKTAGKIRYRFTLTSGKKSFRYSGLALRVNGKVVGKPTYFGLEDVEEIPQKLLKKIFGEVIADNLGEGVITSDWGAIIENSIAYEELQNYIKPILEQVVRDKYKDEVKMQKARLAKLFNQRLSKLPEYKRKYAERALNNILKKFYHEKTQRIASIINVVLDGLEKDEYWEVLKNIEEAKHIDVYQFSEALSDFGFVDMILIAKQAQNRLKFLDYLDDLILDRATDEATIHKAIEKNLWVLDSSFSLISSNQTLKKTVERMVNEKYKGDRASKRPDLLLAQTLRDRYILIELKRPSETIKRDHERQALEYRDDLHAYLSNKKIEVWVIGGKVNPLITSNYQSEDVKLLSFVEIISNARAQLEWLLEVQNS